MAEIVLSSAAIFLPPIIEVLLDKLISPDLIKFAREEKVHTSVNKWKGMVETIKAVLDVAEDKQIINQAEKDWLGKLQFLAHDAEDVLDLFATEILRRKLKAETQASTSKFKLRSIIPTCCTSFKPSALLFNTNMGSKINEITTGFKQLKAQKKDLDLLMVHPGGEPRRTRERQATPTTSVPESHVYGREEEKAAILKLVLSSEANDDHGVSVIPIFGLGGVGKTTIARLVYNDIIPIVGLGGFDLKAWVCVSDEEKFHIIRVTKAILESFTNQAPDVTTLNSLQERLVKKLSNKKFLLVLDDVWLENYEEWTALHRPLEEGAPGSKIIVTTRNEDVAKLTGAIPYPLNHLSYDDCLSLFIHHASVDFDKHPSLRHICEEIVQRCKGLPLAAKALGGLLRGKVNPDEWKTVLDSPLWELPEGKCQLFPVLRLSYHHLPSHLKQCFAFCAIFPKDYEFEEEKLVLLWMAVGLVVKQESKERHLEDVGGGYFRDLLSRSFFQPSSSNESMFVMHDLVNDLAQWVAGETTFRLEEKQGKISTNALHSSYVMSEYDGVKKFEAFDGLQRLRTFLPLMPQYRSYLTNDVPLKLLPKFKCLRALSLSNYDIVELPDSIGDLKHLRYFDLSETRIKSLPESTSTLYNLQTLILKGCSSLEKLPTEMRNLINLHHLDIIGADSLKEMPPGIGKLMNLQILSNFIVGNNGGLEIKELMGLNNLRRTLCISRLENVVHAWDAREARLKDKQDLDELTLQWSSESRNEGAEKEVLDMLQPHEKLKVLDMLQPHEKLKGLTIKCYGGSRFSTWVGDSCFHEIVSLRLEDCKKCESLPPMGQLPLLKDLFIKGMKKVNRVGNEFCGEGIGKPFSSLEALRFEDMEEWEQWEKCGQVEVFPQLRKLSVRSCPKLLGNIPDHLPSLEKLKIRECEQLSVSISGVPKLCKLDIEGCQEMVQSSLINIDSLKSVTLCDISKLTCVREEGFVKRLRKVEELKISGCEEVACLWQKGVGLLQQLTSLVHLRIKGCTEKVVSLLEEAAEAEAEEVGCRLESLELIGCENLETLQGLPRLTGLRVLSIRKCPRLVYFPATGLPSTLRVLKIEECDLLKSVVRGGQLPSILVIRNCKNLQWLVEEDSTMQKSNTTSLFLEDCPALTSLSSRGGELPATLKHLEIRDCSMLESIAEEFCNDSSLERIMIVDCKSLKSLPKGLHNLSHLRAFQIVSCPNLILFADGLVLPSTNLREVWIYNCEKVEALPNGMHNLNCLEELIITNCPGIISFPEEGFPTNLTTLYIENLKINKLVLEWGLNRLTSLKQLCIKGGIPDLASFPPEEDGMMLPASLTKLYIDKFPSLERLSWKGFQNLNSLEQLWIGNCPNLKSFPKEGLPPSLLELGSYGCPLLEEACEKNKGRDWPKIAHIPCVEIN